MINTETNYTMSSKLYFKYMQDSQVYIYNKFSKTACYLTLKEVEILKKLDGKKNYFDLSKENVFALSENGYKYFINKMISLDLIEGFERKQKRNIFRYKIGLFNPNEYLDKMNNYIFMMFLIFFYSFLFFLSFFLHFFYSFYSFNADWFKSYRHSYLFQINKVNDKRENRYNTLLCLFYFSWYA